MAFRRDGWAPRARCSSCEVAFGVSRNYHAISSGHRVGRSVRLADACEQLTLVIMYALVKIRRRSFHKAFSISFFYIIFLLSSRGRCSRVTRVNYTLSSRPEPWYLIFTIVPVPLQPLSRSSSFVDFITSRQVPSDTRNKFSFPPSLQPSSLYSFPLPHRAAAFLVIFFFGKTVPLPGTSLRNNKPHVDHPRLLAPGSNCSSGSGRAVTFCPKRILQPFRFCSSSRSAGNLINSVT